VVVMEVMGKVKGEEKVGFGGGEIFNRLDLRPQEVTCEKVQMSVSLMLLKFLILAGSSLAFSGCTPAFGRWLAGSLIFQNVTRYSGLGLR
ncbi:hypothetical protein HAX54_016933, partial [Datura stramonium]|nr:hypothetical protein [Datura stramonium]